MGGNYAFDLRYICANCVVIVAVMGRSQMTSSAWSREGVF